MKVGDTVYPIVNFKYEGYTFKVDSNYVVVGDGLCDSFWYLSNKSDRCMESLPVDVVQSKFIVRHSCENTEIKPICMFS